MSQDDNSRKIDTDLEAELKRLRQALDNAVESRLSGEPTVSLDEARAMLNEKFKATPHDPCASDAPSRFSSDCLNSTQACKRSSLRFTQRQGEFG